MKDFNGITVIPDQSWSTAGNNLEFFSDASGDTGYGGFFMNEWFQGKMATVGIAKKINCLERVFFP